MQSSLAWTALLMGITGGPHCVAMCGAACAGIGQGAGDSPRKAIASFQAGRILGYSLLGTLAAASMQGLGWLTVQSAALRPVWQLLHVAAIVLGVVLMWNARQPIWLEQVGRSVWGWARRVGARSGGGPWILGMLWALLPCGLLYSALLVAAMTSSPAEGGLVMGLFALGTSVSMTLAPILLLKLGQRSPASGAWGIRIAGAALAASSAWALWMGLVHNTAPWCVN